MNLITMLKHKKILLVTKKILEVISKKKIAKDKNEPIEQILNRLDTKEKITRTDY